MSNFDFETPRSTVADESLYLVPCKQLRLLRQAAVSRTIGRQVMGNEPFAMDTELREWPPHSPMIVGVEHATKLTYLLNDYYRRTMETIRSSPLSKAPDYLHVAKRTLELTDELQSAVQVDLQVQVLTKHFDSELDQMRGY